MLAKVEDKKVFTEGPAVDRAGNVFFTNVRMAKILKYSPKTKKLTTYREKSNLANGLYFDPQGRLLACEGGAGRVTRTDMKTGKIEVLAGKSGRVERFSDRTCPAIFQRRFTASSPARRTACCYNNRMSEK